jgi:hypothetical protein
LVRHGHSIAWREFHDSQMITENSGIHSGFQCHSLEA